jgi:hypothetical protein
MMVIILRGSQMQDEQLEINRKKKNLTNQIKIVEASIRLHQTELYDTSSNRTGHSRWHHERMLEVETKKLSELLNKLNSLEG